jgi:hypothetical protein
MLDNTAKAMLVENMRKSLAKSVLGNKELTESAQNDGINFIAEKATYEQLLNLTMNPLRESKYLPDYVLEGAVAICSSAMMTGRKIIGVNAITEGALNLQKKTGAIITESMLDAALELAKGNGLHVVADCLKEAFAITEAKLIEESQRVDLSHRGAALLESVMTEAKGGAALKKAGGAVKKLGGKVKAGIKKAGEAAAKPAKDAKAAVKKVGDTKAVAKLADNNPGAKGATKKMLKKSSDAAKKRLPAEKKDATKKVAKAAAIYGGAAAAGAAGAYGIKKWHDSKK